MGSCKGLGDPRKTPATDSRWVVGANGPQVTGDEAGKAMGERMGASGGLAGWLFGRRTYEGLLTYWNATGGPFKDARQQHTQIRRLNHSPRSAGVAEFNASRR